MYRIDDWRLSCSIHQLSLPLVIFPISNIIPCSGRNGRFLLKLEVLLLSTDFLIEILILRKTKKLEKKLIGCFMVTRLIHGPSLLSYRCRFTEFRTVFVLLILSSMHFDFVMDRLGCMSIIRLIHPNSFDECGKKPS